MILKLLGLLGSSAPYLELSIVDGIISFDAQNPQLTDWIIWNGRNYKNGSNFNSREAASGSFANYAAQTWMHGLTYTDGTSPTSATAHKTSVRFDTLNGYISFLAVPISNKRYQQRFYYALTRYSAKLTVTLKDSDSNVLRTGSIIKKCPDSNGYVGYLQANFYDPAATLLDVTATWVNETGNYTGGSGRLYCHSFTLL